MADSKITALASIGTGTDPANDPLVIVDVSDVSPGGMSATGTTKKVTLNNLLACSPTATLASATITGDLTVKTNVLKVDTTNNRVGIGTATPSVALDVVGASAISGTVSVGTTTPLATGSGRGNVTVNGSTDAILAFGIAGVNSGFVLQDSAGMTLLSSGATYLRCYTNGSERYKIDSTGVATWSNVGGVAGTAMTLNATGLGVGASPLSASKLTLNGGTGDTSSQDSIFSLIRTSSTGNVLTGKVVLAQKTTDFGNIVFRIKTTASSAENPAYYTDALTIDGEKGNVGIGVTPSAWLTSNSVKAIQIPGGSFANFSTTAVYLAQNWFLDSSSNDKYVNNGFACQYQQYQGQHIWKTAPSGTAGTAITFTQAMTLDASGRLLVGTANASVTSETGCRLLLNNGATGHFTLAITTNQNTAATSCYDFYSTSAAAYRFYVTSAGVINATNTTISAISDARLKENVQDIDVGLGAILALKPRKFDWKAGKGKDIKGDRGFIAQEFEQVFPNLIDEWKDPAPEGEAPYKSVRQDLIPVLVKAIQELTARVQTLETR